MLLQLCQFLAFNLLYNADKTKEDYEKFQKLTN